jgi:hypothetical protein
VTKNIQEPGKSDITLSGDIQDDVYDLIIATWPQVVLSSF